MRHNWASNLKMDSCILADDKSNIETIGGMAWNELTVVVRLAFISANDLNILHNFCLARDLGKIIGEHISAKSLRDLVAPKKKSESTKPKCITLDGALYHVINTINECKESFIETKNAPNKKD